eukprot:scaffold2357_cov399-Prasinococcus_capsulatus_cf.AAC.16
MQDKLRKSWFAVAWKALRAMPSTFLKLSAGATQPHRPLCRWRGVLQALKAHLWRCPSERSAHAGPRPARRRASRSRQLASTPRIRSFAAQLPGPGLGCDVCRRSPMPWSDAPGMGRGAGGLPERAPLRGSS